MAVLEAPRQILEQASRRRDLRLVGPGHDRPHPGALALQEMLHDVPQLVDVTPVNEGGGAKGLRHRFVKRLRAIEDDQEAAVGAQAAALQIGQEALTDGRILRRSLPEPEGVLAAGVIDAERHHNAVLADMDAANEQRRSRTGGSAHRWPAVPPGRTRSERHENWKARVVPRRLQPFVNCLCSLLMNMILL